jgi:hypothetical protein
MRPPSIIGSVAESWTLVSSKSFGLGDTLPRTEHNRLHNSPKHWYRGCANACWPLCIKICMREPVWSSTSIGGGVVARDALRRGLMVPRARCHIVTCGATFILATSASAPITLWLHRRLANSVSHCPVVKHFHIIVVSSQASNI